MQESWNWAVTKGYLMQNPDQYGDWFVLTTEGEKHLENQTVLSIAHSRRITK